MQVHRLLVVLPNWVGDVVLASPALAALRGQYAEARITYLCRRSVADVVAHSGWMDELAFWPDEDGTGPRTIWGLGRALRQARFDLAVLLPNSFRAGLAVWLSGAPRRVGYARDGRGWMLTDRLYPARRGWGFAPVSMLDYYNALAERAGCREVGRRPTLAIGPDDEAAMAARLGDLDDGRPLVVLNPGGAYGTAKLWPAERFAAVGDALVREYDARVVVSGVPGERAIGERIVRAAKEPVTVCVDPPLGLGPLKALVRRARLLVTNDTGPRHYAVALGRPVVTVFGPTDPAWTEAHFALERKVMLSLECQPCQKKRCPLGHNDCMMKLEVERVLSAARELLGSGAAMPAASGAGGT